MSRGRALVFGRFGEEGESVRTSVWIVGAWLLMGALSGCGGGSVPPAEEPKAPEEEGAGRRRASGPSVESEVGALDEGKVKETFERLSGKLSGCYNQGTQRIAYLAGEVRFVVRVAKDGSVHFAFVKDSTLGDRETERCMLSVLQGTAWPKPEGGGEGLAENSFTFEPSGEERPPVSWSPEQLGPAYKKAKSAIAHCGKTAGAKSLKVTMYVETDGKAAAVGVAGDEKSEGAASCVVDAMKGLKFPSPGSYAAKVTVTAD